jgi:hypothetical protein
MGWQVPSSSPDDISRLRLKVVPNADNAKALAQFDRSWADLAILRTDAKLPPRARTIAILEHDVLRLISPGVEKNVVMVKAAQSA